MSFSRQSARAIVLVFASSIGREAFASESVFWVDQYYGKLLRLELSTGQVKDVLANPVVQPANVVLDPGAGKMYWEDQNAFKLQRSNLDGSELEDLVIGGEFARPASVVVDTVAQMIFWAQGDAVRGADLDGTDAFDLVRGQLRPDGLALDAGARKLYWDDDYGNIQRANLDGSDHEVLLTTGAFFQTPVRLDLVRGKMYWAAGGFGSPGKIARANLDGSGLEDLVVIGFTAVQQLTLDAESGKIYWSVFLPTAIRRSNLDGSNVEDVVASGLVLPRSFAVDSAGGKIYWTEEQGSKIRRADLNGANVQELQGEGVGFPDGIRLDLDAGKMYWTNVGLGKIRRAELDGSNAEDLVSRIFIAPGGAAIDRVGRRVYWSDRVTGIHRIRFDGSGFETPIGQGLGSTQSIALDPSGGKMYWTDGGDDRVRGKVRRANLDGSDIEDLVVSGFTLLSDVALDLSRGKMYWNELFPGRIRRANLDGSGVEDVLVTTVSELRGLAIDPLAGKMYWGQSVGTPGFGILRRANLDGSQPRNLALGFPNALALDLLDRKVYWTGYSGGEFGENFIVRADLDGSDRESLVSDGLGTPWGIALEIAETPLAGTGLFLEEPGGGRDRFLSITPTVPEVETKGSIQSARRSVKDIARDPATGILYTIDLTSGPAGQRLYRQDPSGPWVPLPNPTGVPAPGLIWGLAFDDKGNLFGGGAGVYTIDKVTGQAFLLAGMGTAPAFIFGMAASPTGSGFLSTGLLPSGSQLLPYVGLHAPDGAIVPDALFFPLDLSGKGRLLFDIAWSKEGLLYGVAWPTRSLGSMDAQLAGHPPLAERVLGEDVRSELVIVSLARVSGVPLAMFSPGAPLTAVVFGLGENVP